MISILSWVWKRKIFFIMRLTFLIVLLCVLQSFAIEGFSQSQRLSINQKNISVEDVLQKIENQTDYYFMYSALTVDVKRIVDVEATDKSVPEILADVFKGTDISYKIKGRLIALSSNNEAVEIAQQPISLSGNVTESSGSPLPGVTVIVKGTTRGTVTDSNGNYFLSNVSGDGTLVFSFIGMRTQEIPISNSTKIDVVMEEDAVGLDEVVAIGYGTRKKRDITGSISSVQGNELTQSASGDVGQALSGRAAGVYVVSDNGKPGSGVSIRIRGIGGINNSEPLYVIDGVQGASISDISPNDIQSLEVLKDAASAAIYGARGANGVVLITTKRGEMGKPKVTYSGSFGSQSMMNPANIRFLNAREYAQSINDSYTAAGLDPVFGGPNTSQYPIKYFPAPDQLGEGTDWMEVMTRKIALVQKHNLSVSGGNENHKIFLSAGYLDQDGILKFSGYKRYTFRFNSDNKINKWLTIGNSTSFTHGVQLGGHQGSAGQYTDLYYIYNQPPTLSVRNEDGTFAGPPTAFYVPERNPYAKAANTETNVKTNTFNNNLYGQATLLKSIVVKSEFVASLGTYSRDYWYNGIFNEGTVGNALTTVYGDISKGLYWMWSNTANYNKTFGNHSINILAGYEMSKGSSTSFSGQANYADPAIQVVGTSGSEMASINQNVIESSTLSTFGRFAYNYKSKYYLTANIRRDGSSKFGANNHFGVFPSFSAAWRLSGEEFFPKGIFDDLKFRASYGEVGNDKIGDYAYIAQVGSVVYSMSGESGSFQNGMILLGAANPDLKWETSRQLNFGFDIALLKNNLTLTADYFQTKVSDMLLGISIPVTSGISDTWWDQYASIITNLGELENKGFEFAVNYKRSLGELSFSVDANLTTFNNKVTDIGENPYLQGNVSRTYVGGALGDFYGYVCEGIFQTQAEVDAANDLTADPDVYYQYNETAPGDFKFADLNGDHVITDADQKVIGSPVPKFIYGFGLSLDYRQFSMSALFNGSHGNKIYNEVRAMDLESTGNTGNKISTVLNAWHGEGTSNTISRRFTSDPNRNQRTSSNYVEDGSYLRLRNIEFSYSLPKTFTSKLSCDNASVFISGENLFTLTKYQGFDPEINISQGGNNLNAGYDHSFYMHASTVRLGLKITF